MRYSRQTILPEVGPHGQEVLKRSRVLCVGVGGLGSPSALYLAAAGVGIIGLIDDDRVDVSNLQRQILFSTPDQGQFKVDVARNQLMRLNPEVQVEVYRERLDASNGSSIVSQYDLVLDGSDNFATQFLLNDLCYQNQIPWIFAGVNRFEAQVALFSQAGDQTSCYRCLYPTIPRAGIKNCAETGVLGAWVGMVGSFQASLALQWLLMGAQSPGPERIKAGTLYSFDGRGGLDLNQVTIRKQPNCPTCSRPRESMVIQDLASLDQAACSVSQGVQCASMLLGASEIALLDVRTLSEFQESTIPGAIHLPLSEIEEGAVPNLSKETKILVAFCLSGKRSEEACRILSERMNVSVRSLIGGIRSYWTLTNSS